MHEKGAALGSMGAFRGFLLGKGLARAGIDLKHPHTAAQVLQRDVLAHGGSSRQSPGLHL